MLLLLYNVGPHVDSRFLLHQVRARDSLCTISRVRKNDAEFAPSVSFFLTFFFSRRPPGFDVDVIGDPSSLGVGPVVVRPLLAPDQRPRLVRPNLARPAVRRSRSHAPRWPRKLIAAAQRDDHDALRPGRFAVRQAAPVRQLSRHVLAEPRVRVPAEVRRPEPSALRDVHVPVPDRQVGVRRREQRDTEPRRYFQFGILPGRVNIRDLEFVSNANRLVKSRVRFWSRFGPGAIANRSRAYDMDSRLTFSVTRVLN